MEPVDSDLIQLLRDRDGIRTDVTLKDGRILAVFNVAWGYDMDDPFAHLSANVSPTVEGHALDFFFTHDVAAIADPETGSVLYDPPW